jgi:hypothetical protein
MVHHPVFEEAYCLDGHMVYNFGTTSGGTYFFRPARVKHGHFVSGEERGWTGFFRLDGTLVNWITINERIICEGDAVKLRSGDRGAGHRRHPGEIAPDRGLGPGRPMNPGQLDEGSSMSQPKVDFSAIRGDWRFHLNYLRNAIDRTLERQQGYWREMDHQAAPAGYATTWR